MGRYKQKSNSKGSLKLIQTLVNKHTNLLNSKLSSITSEQISWVSPLHTDEYAEYRDQTFLERLNVNAELTKKLIHFWPRNGPQWDALGKFEDNGILLVETKANLPELESPPSSSTNPISRQLITQSLGETKTYIGADPNADWIDTYYQYANRLAHLYFFRVLHNIPAYLVMIYFIGDEATNGPTSRDQWEAAIEKMHKTLGILNNHPLERYLLNVFIHVNELS